MRSFAYIFNSLFCSLLLTVYAFTVTCPPAHLLPACLPACMPTCLSAYLHARLPASCLPACMPTCLYACMPECLSACLPMNVATHKAFRQTDRQTKLTVFEIEKKTKASQISNEKVTNTRKLGTKLPKSSSSSLASFLSLYLCGIDSKTFYSCNLNHKSINVSL